MATAISVNADLTASMVCGVATPAGARVVLRVAQAGAHARVYATTPHLGGGAISALVAMPTPSHATRVHALCLHLQRAQHGDDR